jgi:hypothetical protein
LPAEAEDSAMFLLYHDTVNENKQYDLICHHSILHEVTHMHIWFVLICCVKNPTAQAESFKDSKGSDHRHQSSVNFAEVIFYLLPNKVLAIMINSKAKIDHPTFFMK